MKSFSLTFTLSIIFFLLQLCGVVYFEQSFQEGVVKISAKLPFLPMVPGQRKALEASSKALASRSEPGGKIFFFGGSTSDNFFKNIGSPDENIGLHCYDLTCATQSMYDVLRIASNINGPGLAILGIHPAKMFSHTDAQVVSGRYMTGQNYFFLLQSSDAERFYQHGGEWQSRPSSKTRRFASLNPEFGLINQAENLLLFNKKRIETLFLKNNSRKIARTVDQEEENDGLPALNRQQRLNKFVIYRESLATEREQRIALNFRLLGEVASLLRSKGIALAVFETPVGTLYRDNLSDYIAQYNKSMSEFLSKHPRVKRYDLPWSIYDGDESLFQDSMHVTSDGATFFRPHFLTLLRETVLPEAGLH